MSELLRKSLFSIWYFRWYQIFCWYAYLTLCQPKFICRNLINRFDNQKEEKENRKNSCHLFLISNILNEVFDFCLSFARLFFCGNSHSIDYINGKIGHSCHSHIFIFCCSWSILINLRAENRKLKTRWGLYGICSFHNFLHKSLKSENVRRAWHFYNYSWN